MEQVNFQGNFHKKQLAEELLFGLWRDLHDGKYGDGERGMDLEALTDDLVGGLEEVKYQEEGDALSPEPGHEAAQDG